MDKYGIIYTIRNKINGKIYIGQTAQKGGFNRRYHVGAKDKEGIERVYNNYMYNKEHNGSYNSHLLNAIEKYGFEAFEVNEEFDVAYSKEELDRLEDMYIKIYNTIDGNCGYNNRYGGSSGKLTEETKKRLSEVQSGEKSAWWGKHHTEETKQLMSNKASGEGNSMYGKTYYLNPRAKAVYCYEIDDIRLTAKEWSEELNISRGTISECCNGKLSQTKGYHFRWGSEEEIKEYKSKHGIDQ